MLTRGPGRRGDGYRMETWDGCTVGAWGEELEGARAVVHLSGRRVDTRATKRNVDDLISSRVQPVRVLGEALRACLAPPPTWVQSSSLTVFATMVTPSSTRRAPPPVSAHARWSPSAWRGRPPSTRRPPMSTAPSCCAWGSASAVKVTPPPPSSPASSPGPRWPRGHRPAVGVVGGSRRPRGRHAAGHRRPVDAGHLPRDLAEPRDQRRDDGGLPPAPRTPRRPAGAGAPGQGGRTPPREQRPAWPSPAAGACPPACSPRASSSPSPPSSARPGMPSSAAASCDHERPAGESAHRRDRRSRPVPAPGDALMGWGEPPRVASRCSP